MARRCSTKIGKPGKSRRSDKTSRQAALLVINSSNQEYLEKEVQVRRPGEHLEQKDGQEGCHVVLCSRNTIVDILHWWLYFLIEPYVSRLFLTGGLFVTTLQVREASGLYPAQSSCSTK